MEKIDIHFPKHFYWGAATASHQVEGGLKNDWTEWEKSSRRIRMLKKKGLIKKYGFSNFISGKACDQYRLYQQDFILAKELGHNATRISLEWSRIEPKKGVFNEKEINHYRKVIKTLRALGIEPFITLWHWTIPCWLINEGGVQSNNFAKYFARYAEKIVSSLRDGVKFWITINEPEVFTSAAYLTGIRPPGKRNIFTSLQVIRHLIAAHRGAYKMIKRIDSNAQVGIAKNNVYFEAAKKKFLNRLLKRIADWWWNEYFLHNISDRQDFIGLNHYYHHKIDRWFNKNEDAIVSDVGWELYPPSVYYVLKDLKKYKKPIYITENGLADASDQKRSWYIFEILKNIYKAISEGIEVKGYLHWTLLDNFEWEKGFWPRFGLIEVDYKTLERKIRPSAYFYRDIIRENGITNEIIDKYIRQIKKFSKKARVLPKMV